MGAGGKVSAVKLKKCLNKLEFNWELSGKSLVIQTKTKDFNQAAWVISKVAKAADELNHHPDIWLTNYNSLAISLFTHEAGGITDKDIALAERIDAILARI